MDAIRVSQGREQQPGQTVDAMQEMIYSKCGDVVGGAIPAGVLQAYAFLYIY
jgi:hypothetical protein